MQVTNLNVVHIRTTNDTNGNPRRGWLVTMTATTDASKVSHLSRCMVDEGYEGSQAVERAMPWLAGPELAWAVDSALEVNVQPKEYRRLVKQYGTKG